MKIGSFIVWANFLTGVNRRSVKVGQVATINVEDDTITLNK